MVVTTIMDENKLEHMESKMRPCRFKYRDSDIIYGRGRVAELENYLAKQNWKEGLVVCGPNVSANSELMKPIRSGLNDKFAGIFDETTPEKKVETVYAGIERIGDLSPDVLIGVGGGSSLDVTRQMGVFAAIDSDLATLRSQAQSGFLPRLKPDKPVLPVIVIPTTFAGADISDGGSIKILSANESPTAQPIRTKGSNMPSAMFYDPNLFETTPWGVLSGSLMNGFDKGIEALYSDDSNPVRDATATHGLKLLNDSSPRLPEDKKAMEMAITGLILVQLDRRLSLIHAVGHGFSRRYSVHQGNIHAIIAPHILEYIFNSGICRHKLIAQALNIDPTIYSRDELTSAIIDCVVEFRSTCQLPTRLSELDSINKADFPDIANFIMSDPLIENEPQELNTKAKDIEKILREAW